MKIQELPIEDLIPYENNPRDNDGAVDAVAESIKEFGFKQPIVVDKDMVVIVGHTRLKAAERLGLKKVPVLVAKDLNEEQVTAYRLADNKTSEAARWDFTKLYEELECLKIEIPELDMSAFGFDEINFEKKETKKKQNDSEEVICPRCGHVQGVQDEDC